MTKFENSQSKVDRTYIWEAEDNMDFWPTNHHQDEMPTDMGKMDQNQ